MSLDMIENENINDNDILTSLNDLITDIISHDPIQSEKFNENGNTTLFINSMLI
ncbi:unnamed protein product, partial [Rotaria sp. Silwood2]